jgi:hypothetical protein
MKLATHGLLALLAATSLAAGVAHAQEPPAPEATSVPATEAAPTPPPAPAAVAPAATVPLAIMSPEWLSGFRRPEQPPYGSLVRPSPAHEVAMLEAGQPMFASDPRVAVAAVLLAELTAAYIEDAPRIAELTVGVVQQVRAANQAASPLEMLVGAVHWNGPAGKRGNVPRKFEEFARRYRAGRLEGKDHASASSLTQPPYPSPPRAGTPVP